MKSTKIKVNNPATTKYELTEVIKERWSPRTFRDDKVKESELMTLFEAARWAASSNNMQPWRFIYAWKGSQEWEEMFSYLVDFNQSWVKNASVLIFTFIKKDNDKGDDNFHALHDLGLAVGNLSIQAQSMGIAVHQMAGIKWQDYHKDNKIPDNFHFATAIAIGYYGGNLDKLSDDLRENEVKERSRKPLSSIISEGKWSNDFEK